MYLHLTLFGLFIFTTNALELGDICNPTQMYKASWQYDDSCDNVYLFCDPVTTSCQFKGCSNSDYIKDWDILVRPLPLRCNTGTFCPDNNSLCTSSVPIGAQCEPQRDDECMGPNSICLNSTCFVKGAPLQGNCGADITSYVVYDAVDNALEQLIIRDNCTDGTYCDLSDNMCIQSKPNGLRCQQDRECLSGTCSNYEVCVNGPDVFLKIEPWLWGVVSTSVFLFVLIVLFVLWILHRYQSRKEHEKIHKFFGDNSEFAQFNMSSNPSIYLQQDSGNNSGRTSLVYLTTPDYNKSQLLSTTRLDPSPPSNNRVSFNESTTPISRIGLS